MILAALLHPGYAQERMKVTASSAPIVLDGLLNEPCWQEAPIISDFRQRNPLEGEPGS